MTTNVSDVTIRIAKEADRETLIELIVRGFADVTVNRWREERYGIIGGRTWDEWKADDTRTINITNVVIAETDGKAVGFATYHVNEKTRIGTVGNNAVLPEYRGRGIGGLLDARVLELIEEAGMEFAQVSTGLEHCYEPARRMYERQGFKELNRSIVYMMRLSERNKV
jgi:GNAT superfamily N-acetyltransferase